MHRATVRRTLVGAVAVALLTVTSGCGSDDESSEGAGGEQGTSDTTAAGEPGADQPRGDDVTLPEDVCTLLTADEVSAAVGATVTLSTGPGGDCAFTEDDPRAISGLIGVVGDADSNGGYDAYLAGVAGTLTEPQKRSLDGLGDAASTYVGVPAFGGSTQLQAGGVVDRGAFLEQVTISQASDLTADRLEPVAEALLRLLDAKLG